MSPPKNEIREKDDPENREESDMNLMISYQGSLCQPHIGLSMVLLP